GRAEHDRLKLLAVEEPAVLRELVVDRAQVLETSLAALVDAASRDLERRVVREEARGLRPKTFLDVEPVRALQVLDLVRVLEERDLVREHRGTPRELRDAIGRLRIRTVRRHDRRDGEAGRGRDRADQADLP